MSPIRELLEGVSATGTLPSEADLAAALPSTASASGRLGDKRGLLTEARKVKALRGPHAESDDPDAEIAEIIEAAEEKFSAGLADRLADQIRGLDNSSGAIERRRQQAQLQRKTVAPLAELLALAGKGDGVDMREVDRLALREGVSAEERNACGRRWPQRVGVLLRFTSPGHCRIPALSPRPPRTNSAMCLHRRGMSIHWRMSMTRDNLQMRFLLVGEASNI